ncbi:MAG: hypothetical protein P4L84_28800 [Isosphaeraceae bacterium]|nr:hypothetical protein [Isosphaeraceae bacterium]
MFSQQELISELPRLADAVSPPMEIAEFSNQDFEPPCSEQKLWAFRGFKTEFASGLRFWIKTLQAQGWDGRESYFMPYAEAGLCEPIAEGEFIRLVAEYTGSLRHALPQYIRELSGFRSGLRMYADWNDVAAMAELDESYVAFYWSTTA